MQIVQNIDVNITGEKNYYLLKILLTNSTINDGNGVQVTRNNQKRNSILFLNICKMLQLIENNT